MPAIELDGLERRYGERTALAGVSVSVDEGADARRCSAPTAPARPRCCACSPACCGRTAATARVLGAELPEERWKLPAKVGYLGHEPLLYRELTGRENLRYHAGLHGVAEERVGELLEAVGMERRADEPLRGALARHGAAPGGRPGGAPRPAAAAPRRAARGPRPGGEPSCSSR